MKIELRNFGKIKRGTLDIDKRVTVFVGYNNSGKTYASQLLWGLNYSGYSFTNQECKNSLQKYFQENDIDRKKFAFDTVIIDKFIGEYEKYLEGVAIQDFFNVKSDYFKKEKFSVQFDDDYIKKIESTSASVYVLVSNENSDENNVECYRFHTAVDSLSVTVERSEFSSREDFQRSINQNVPRQRVITVKKLKLDIQWKRSILRILSMILLEDAYSACFLPANRIFYPTYYKYIYSATKGENNLLNEMLDEADDLDFVRSAFKIPYTEPVDELIQRYFNLKSDEKADYGNFELMNECRRLIGGDIQIRSSEGIAPIEFYLKLEDGKELDMYMSSSSANQLATLYLYFKYWADEKNNFLIIDEPEENLHPENQILLIDLLMKFVNSNNNKLLITSHSPMIANLINNYAHLCFLRENGVDIASIIKDHKIELKPIENIMHSDFGVYFFNGDSIKEYDIGTYGVFFEDFQKAENRVKGISDLLKDNIYNILHENE